MADHAHHSDTAMMKNYVGSHKKKKKKISTPLSGGGKRVKVAKKKPARY